jgi:CheY-like chemotaxis protein
LLNLAVNARDAMPEGGRLVLSCQPLAEPSADLASELAAGLAAGRSFGAIEVSDNGTGMAPGVAERAFEPFFTTKDLGRGTGLGLSSVFGFVKQSQGAVRLRSALGSGTTVTLVLPAARPGAGPHAAAPASWPDRGPTLPAGLHVLLVDDQDEVRQAVAQTLHTLGCRVTGLGTAEEALAHLGEQSLPDLLLSDVALGNGMPGTELARLARERWPAMGRLLMSGYAHEWRDSGPAGGADELLAKPFERAALLAAMRRALDAAALSAAPPRPPAG